MKESLVVVRVDFPALADLVLYLRERDTQQKKVDELAEQVKALTGKLSQSSAGLQASIEETKL